MYVPTVSMHDPEIKPMCIRTYSILRNNNTKNAYLKVRKQSVTIEVFRCR